MSVPHNSDLLQHGSQTTHNSVLVSWASGPNSPLRAGSRSLDRLSLLRHMLRTETGENNCTVMRQGRPLDSGVRQKGLCLEISQGQMVECCKAAIGPPQPVPWLALQDRVLLSEHVLRRRNFQAGHQHLVLLCCVKILRPWLCMTLEASAQRGRYLSLNPLLWSSPLRTPSDIPTTRIMCRESSM